MSGVAVCSHGVTEPRSTGVAMNAPWAVCRCCRFTFYYVDFGSYSMAGSTWKTWTPKDLCGSCGGAYVEGSTVRSGSGGVTPGDES